MRDILQMADMMCRTCKGHDRNVRRLTSEIEIKTEYLYEARCSNCKKLTKWEVFDVRQRPA